MKMRFFASTEEILQNKITVFWVIASIARMLLPWTYYLLVYNLYLNKSITS